MFAAMVAALALAAVVGMALLWPGDVDTKVGEAIVTKSDTATVMSVSTGAAMYAWKRVAAACASAGSVTTNDSPAPARAMPSRR